MAAQGQGQGQLGVPPFSALPYDATLSILERLAFRDLCRATAVSKALRATLIGAPALWSKCLLGACDERLTNEVLQRYTSWARDQLTHVEVISAPNITAAALTTAVAENQIQFLDLRGCEEVNLLDLREHLHHDALQTCRIAPQGGQDYNCPHLFLTLGKNAAADAKQPWKERCRAMLPCAECAGFDFRTCQECDEPSAPWRECRVDDCKAKL